MNDRRFRISRWLAVRRPSNLSARTPASRLTPCSLRALIATFVLGWPLLLPAANERLLILHTNDIHDHVRPGPNGLGGMPYVAGYIEKVRAESKNVLVVDAGDVTEKGDLVAHRTHGELTFELFRRVGYHAVAIGNHDYDDPGVEGIRRFESVLGQQMLCLNIVRADGTPEFTPSKVVTIGALKVAIIGMIVPRRGNADITRSGELLARESARLKPSADLLIALCHERPLVCEKWSEMAPQVDIFVAGHDHAVLPKPMVVPRTGALIVLAGWYAGWVGRLEVVVDTDAKKIADFHGELVRMRHDAIPADEEMIRMVQDQEAKLCPEAATVVVRDNAHEVSMTGIAWLAAEALRQAAEAELGFCHAKQIIRSSLPTGPVDVNALFLTGGQRGHHTVRTQLSGQEVAAYLKGLAEIDMEQTNWAGFIASQQIDANGRVVIQTNLEPSRRYDVIMPQMEWMERWQRMVARARIDNDQGPLVAREFTAERTSITFTEALRTEVERLAARGLDLSEEADRLMKKYSQP